MNRPTIVPHLTVSPAPEAVAFYLKVFRATEKVRRMAGDGKRIFHCELEFNGGIVMLSDAFPEHGSVTAFSPSSLNTVAISIDIADATEVDAIATRAMTSGAILEMKPQDTFWGTRFAKFRDPFGHRWLLNAPLKD